VFDTAGVDPPDGIAAGGEGLVVADLVAQLAGHPLGHAIAVTIDQAHRLVVHLVLVVAEPASGEVHIQIVTWCEAVLRQRHFGAHVEEVAGLVVVPAAVGQEGARIIHRHAAQAVAAEVLGDVGELQHQLAGPADVEGQRGVADHAFAVGVPAHALFTVGIQPGAIAHAAGGIQRPGTLDRSGTKVLVAQLDLDVASGAGFRFAGYIVDDAACITTAIQRTCRSLQHFHALDVEQLRDRETCIRVAAQAVIQHVLLAEAAQGHPGIAEVADAADAAIEVGHLTRGLIVDQFTRDDLDRLWDQLQRCIRAGADRSIVHPVQGLCTSANFDLVQVLWRGSGGLDSMGKGCQGQGQCQAQGALQGRWKRHRERGACLQMRKISICNTS